MQHASADSNGRVDVGEDNYHPDRSRVEPAGMSSYSGTSGVDRFGITTHREQGTGLVSAGRTQRAAAAKATDNGKRIAEMILECNEDGDQGLLEEEEHRGGVSERAYDEGEGLDDCDGGSSNSSSTLYGKKPLKTRWSASEDTKLKDAVDTYGSGNWKQVSEQ